LLERSKGGVIRCGMVHLMARRGVSGLRSRRPLRACGNRKRRHRQRSNEQSDGHRVLHMRRGTNNRS
jgi:hypothetical protein